MASTLAFSAGCGGDDDSDCGPVAGQLTVTFKQGVTRADVEAICAEIGATVVYYPVLSTTYAIEYPASMSFKAAREYFYSKPGVVAVQGSINYCLYD